MVVGALYSATATSICLSHALCLETYGIGSEGTAA